MNDQLKIEKTKEPKQKPAPSHLGFGQYFTDHMFYGLHKRKRMARS